MTGCLLSDLDRFHQQLERLFREFSSLQLEEPVTLDTFFSWARAQRPDESPSTSTREGDVVIPNAELDARAQAERTELGPGAVRPFVLELQERGDVTAEEWAIHMNSRERQALLGVLVDRVFVSHFLHSCSNINQSYPGTYNWSVVHDLVPEAERRLRRLELRTMAWRHNGVYGKTVETGAEPRRGWSGSRVEHGGTTEIRADGSLMRHYDVRSAYPGTARAEVKAEVAPLDTFNLGAVTAHQGAVVVMAKIPPSLSPEQALMLGSWLIVGAELAGHERALETAVATVEAIRNT